MPSSILKRNPVLLIVSIVCGAAVFAGIFIFTDWGVEDLKGWINYWTEEVRTWPAVPFFFALSLLPLTGFPISPLFIAAGVKFGVLLAIPFSMAALAVNLVIAHWISTHVFRRFIQKIARNWNYTIPKISKANAIKWVAIVRISGAPLAVQNYLLGLAHAPFWPYLLVSLAVQSVFVVLTIVLGDAILSGNIAKTIVGFGLLIAAIIIVSYLRKRYGEPKSGPVDTSGE